VVRAIEESGEEAELVPIKTKTAVQDKSRFVKDVDEALLRGEVDMGVHSAKDVPSMLPEGLAIVGAPAAEDARDALVGTARSLDALPAGVRVGTSSVRRRSQLLAIRPDLEVSELRGNVDTRLRKLAQRDYDAIVLALAGLRRLGRESEAGAVLDGEQFIPAPGQGILLIEARSGDSSLADLAKAISDSSTVARLQAERAAVATLGGSCRTPIAVNAGIDGTGLRLLAYVGAPDGRDWIRDEVTGDRSEPEALGHALAERMLAAGARELLERAEKPNE
jgi:hydroxymethylbilane synthase